MIVSHRYDFQRPSIKTYRGRRRNHVRQHSISRRGVVEVRPSRAREENRAGDAQRPARRGNRRDGRGRALREDGRPRGVPFRPLQEEAGHHERRGRARRPQVSRRHLPDRRHRALPQTGDERRGGNHRDVPGGRLRAPHQGRLRDPVGRGRLGRNRVEPQREGARKRGCLADRAAFRRLPVPVRRRRIPEAKLGRVLRERRGDGRLGVDSEGRREIAGCAEGFTVHFYRNVFGKVPRQKRTRVAKMLEAVHAQESREASEAKASEVAARSSR